MTKYQQMGFFYNNEVLHSSDIKALLAKRPATRSKQEKNQLFTDLPFETLYRIQFEYAWKWLSKDKKIQAQGGKSGRGLEKEWLYETVKQRFSAIQQDPKDVEARAKAYRTALSHSSHKQNDRTIHLYGGIPSFAYVGKTNKLAASANTNANVIALIADCVGLLLAVCAVYVERNAILKAAACTAPKIPENLIKEIADAGLKIVQKGAKVADIASGLSEVFEKLGSFIKEAAMDAINTLSWLDYSIAAASILVTLAGIIFTGGAALYLKGAQIALSVAQIGVDIANLCT
jgi:hypothetical protein